MFKAVELTSQAEPLFKIDILTDKVSQQLHPYGCFQIERAGVCSELTLRQTHKNPIKCLQYWHCKTPVSVDESKTVARKFSIGGFAFLRGA